MTTAEPSAKAPQSKRSVCAAIGPGLIFAGASVGVSHLVQSTRAGAGWGLALWFVILLALVLKYPPLSFGARYSAATGQSLLEGYRRLGSWALWLFAALTIATMFAVQAAVTIVTAALLDNRLLAWGIGTPGIAWLNVLLLASCGALLLIGGYRWLDRITKLLVPLFTVLTIIAAVAVVPHLGTQLDTFWPALSTWETLGTVAFVAALIGWMPTAIDLATWQSLWVLERGRMLGTRPSVRDAMLDFNIGYICTGVLAFCFLVLGAGTISMGMEFPTSGIQFPGFFIDMYAVTVGQWAGDVVAVAALAIMLSTTVAVLDGFPRVIAVLVQRFRTPESASGFERSPASTSTSSGRGLYVGAMVVVAGGAIVLLQAMGNAFLPMVDVATIASFLTAPVLAALNHRVVSSSDMPGETRLTGWLRVWSWLSIVSLAAFALFYIGFRIHAWAH